MSGRMNWSTRAALGAIVLLFIGSAMLFVSRPGIEADEALVANPAQYYWHHIPMMLMSYLGALKMWFYMGLFAMVKPGPVSLRVQTAAARGRAKAAPVRPYEPEFPGHQL